jgi:hypothetical protein
MKAFVSAAEKAAPDLVMRSMELVILPRITSNVLLGGNQSCHGDDFAVLN